MTQTEQAPSLLSAARKGMLWQAVAFAVARLSILLSTIVLARALGPEDFGVISLGLVVVMALTLVADLGAGQALVYLSGSTRRNEVAFLLVTVSAAVVTLAWVAVCPALAAGLGHPDATPLFQSLGAVIFLTALGSVPDAVLRKNLEFSRRLPAEMVRGTLRGLGAVVLVAAGLSGWALVWAEVIGAVGYLVVSWRMARFTLHRGSLASLFDRAQLQPLLSFGIPASLNGILAAIALNIDYLIVGAVLGAAPLGLYVVGFRIPELLVVSVFRIFSQVAYPVYAQVQSDRARLRQAFLVTFRVQAAYGLAVSVTAAATAPVLIPLLFGEQYVDAVPVMQAICCYVLAKSLATGAFDVFQAIGRPGLGATLNVVRVVVLVPTLLVGTHWGVLGVAIGQAGVAVIFAVVTLCILSHVIELRMLRLAATILPAVGGAAAAAVAVYGVGLLTSGESWWELGVALLCSAAASLGVFILADPGMSRRLLRG